MLVTYLIPNWSSRPRTVVLPSALKKLKDQKFLDYMKWYVENKDDEAETIKAYYKDKKIPDPVILFLK